MLRFIVLALAFLAPSCQASELANYLKTEKGKGIVVLRAPGAWGGGTGFVLKTPSGALVTITNHHVCDNAPFGKMLAIYNEEGLSPAVLKILKVDAEHDLCMLEPIPFTPGLEVASADEVPAELYVVGHPMLSPLTVSSGRFLTCDTAPIPNFPHGCTTTAFAAPGNSGSPVLNQEGDVVGVVWGIEQDIGKQTTLFVSPENLKNFIADVPAAPEAVL